MLVNWQHQEQWQNKKLFTKKNQLSLAGFNFVLQNFLLILENVRSNQLIFFVEYNLYLFLAGPV